MRTPFTRTGNKYPLRDVIADLIPNHSIYIEPFVGSGAIFFHKEPAQKSILADLDSDVVKQFKMLKRISPNPAKYNIKYTVADIQKMVDAPQKSLENKWLQLLYKKGNTFGNSGKGKIFNNYSYEDKIKRIPEYKEKLRNTIILKQDWKAVVKEYDSPTAFIFLDPPYEKSDGLYANVSINYDEMANILRSIKGKFMLTINDSANIRKIFRGFKMKRVFVKGTSNGNMPLGKNRKELIITNY